MAYSRYAAEGKGLTDEGERRHAKKLLDAGDVAGHREYTTYKDSKGVTKASGAFQVEGHTADSLARLSCIWTSNFARNYG